MSAQGQILRTTVHTILHHKIPGRGLDKSKCTLAARYSCEISGAFRFARSSAHTYSHIRDPPAAPPRAIWARWMDRPVGQPGAICSVRPIRARHAVLAPEVPKCRHVAASSWAVALQLGPGVAADHGDDTVPRVR